MNFISNDDIRAAVADRFSSIFQGKIGVKDVLAFFYHIWRSQKCVEFISFVVCEIMHFFHLFRYVSFSNDTPLRVNSEFDCVENTLSHLGLRIEKTECWKIMFIDDHGNRFGCKFDSPCNLDVELLDGNRHTYRFHRNIVAVFVSSQGATFVCLEGHIMMSRDNCYTFTLSLKFSDENSSFLFDHGITETRRGEILVGEYGNVVERGRFRSVAFLHCSTDGGINWDRSDLVMRGGANKHIHIVKYCYGVDAIVLTDGDNKKKLWIGRLLDGGIGSKYIKWHVVNKYHIQTGGYTSVCDLKGKIIFGSDYYGGTNFLISTGDCTRLVKLVLPDPYRRHPIYRMTQRKMKNGKFEVWALVAGSRIPGTKGLLMLTRDGGRSWIRAIEYNGVRNNISIISASRHAEDSVLVCIISLRATGELKYETFKIDDLSQ